MIALVHPPPVRLLLHCVSREHRDQAECVSNHSSVPPNGLVAYHRGALPRSIDCVSSQLSSPPPDHYRPRMSPTILNVMIW